MLLIIDMQKGFTATSYVAAEVATEVRKARRRREPIILVECNERPEVDWGPTVVEVKKALRGYDQQVLVTKRACDGSREVIAAIENTGFNHDIIRVCGVETNICIQKTVDGLAAHYKTSRIKLIARACGCLRPNGERYAPPAVAIERPNVKWLHRPQKLRDSFSPIFA
jgi:nicotinamidase-related amidase